MSPGVKKEFSSSGAAHHPSHGHGDLFTAKDTEGRGGGKKNYGRKENEELKERETRINSVISVSSVVKKRILLFSVIGVSEPALSEAEGW